MLICINESNEAVGAIDLYDVDFKNGNAAIGILIGDQAHKRKGYAKEAVGLMVEYAKKYLALHNLYCSIQMDNEESIRLFLACGFEQVGIRKNWFLIKGERIHEICFQLCLEE
jgi:diamine N-acetyltransferase